MQNHNHSHSRPSARFIPTLFSHSLFVLTLLVIALQLPAEGWQRFNQGVLLFFGLLALWRYGWGLLHFARATIYRRWVYPRLRQRAETALASSSVPEAYLLVTSFRIDSDTTAKVYRAAFVAAQQSSSRVNVVASIVEMADQRLIKQLFEKTIGSDGSDDRVKLIFVRIPGTGKRDALAFGFKAIARQMPEPDALVAVIDGDSIVPPDLIQRSAGYFKAMPEVGALTTDEVCQVEGRPIFRHWYSLRFAQRHVLMSSMGLSRRVLTLTGRMSMFRAEIICNPSFIKQVELDYIDHWRLGRFKFLTGDDKSTWYWLLSHHYQMLYLPDVEVVTIEQPPTEYFLQSAAMLMTRWYGNMLRTNGRALGLGPQRVGRFVWWAILDQRLSMWTCLTSPIIALLATLFITPYALPVYLIWIVSSRYVLTLLLLTVRPQVSLYYPFLLYFNQVFGALIKVIVFFRLDKQKWTRQKTTLVGDKSNFRARFNGASSVYMQVLSFSLFIYLLALMTGVIELPTGRYALTALGITQP